MSLLYTLNTEHGEREPCSPLACVSPTCWVIKPFCKGICRALLPDNAPLCTCTSAVKVMVCTGVCWELKDYITVKQLKKKTGFFLSKLFLVTAFEQK